MPVAGNGGKKKKKGPFCWILLNLWHKSYKARRKNDVKAFSDSRLCTLFMFLGGFRYIRSTCSGNVVRKGLRGSGPAQSYSGWRSFPPVGSSSSLRFSAAAQLSPELSAAACSPHTGHWSAHLLFHSCAAGGHRE